MSKVDDAREILREFGFAGAQRSIMTALTLLALAGLDEATPWSSASAPRLGIAGPDGIMAFVRDRLGHPYAMNTRESFRKQALHYFVLSGIALRNPDNPDFATNDRRTHYALREETVDLLRRYGSEAWPDQLRQFQAIRPALVARSRTAADS
ncbi:MAG: BsuBI/PstI family type II restriction endonuclease, partial [Acidimicrobiales bacterium]